MDNLLWIVIVGGLLIYRFVKRDMGKQEEIKKQRQIERDLEDIRNMTALKRRSQTPSKKATSTRKLTSSKSEPSKRVSVGPAKKTTKSKQSFKPTYDGPLFAQPGEKSRLFSYASYSGRYEVVAPFSLIDFETSGFHPNSARILEVAVIKVSASGEILDEYTTLINPEDGNVGRTDIHQITLGMVKNAPTLAEIIGDLVSILDSSIVVAHNAKFEENFLDAAFREVGVEHSLMPTIDTLWLSRQILDLPNYKLGTVIDQFGVSFPNAHTALGDVRAMSKVLPEMLEMASEISFPSQLVQSPELARTGKTLPRKSNA